MAITRAQQYKQMLQKGGRIGLKNGPAGGASAGGNYGGDSSGGYSDKERAENRTRGAPPGRDVVTVSPVQNKYGDETQKRLDTIPDKQPFQVGNFINNLITNRRKGAFNLATMIPGSKARITKMRKAYADYLKSVGITPSDELLDTDNLYDFFDKQAFEKGKTAYTGVGIDELNQKIYDKLAEDMGPFSNDPLKNQFETLTQEEFMTQNPDLFSKGTPTDVQSYGDFIAEKFGAPGS